MLSSAFLRGTLADIALPGAAAHPTTAAGRRSWIPNVAFMATGVLLVMFCLWLDDRFLLNQHVSLGGIALDGHTLVADVIMMLGMGGMLTLESLLMPRTLLRDTALTAGGVLLMALSAKISIPLQPVPITGQTFGVLLISAALGWKRGLTTMASYIALGSMGLPIFADVHSPVTYGYLAGFALAAIVVGFLAEHGWDRNLLTSIPAMLLGEVAIYLCGLPWLAQFTGWGLVYDLGLKPFLLGDSIKLVAAALVLPAIWLLTGRAVKNSRRDQQA